jgi:hypothetical protein
MATPPIQVSKEEELTSVCAPMFGAHGSLNLQKNHTIPLQIKGMTNFSMITFLFLFMVTHERAKAIQYRARNGPHESCFHDFHSFSLHIIDVIVSPGCERRLPPTHNVNAHGKHKMENMVRRGSPGEEGGEALMGDNCEQEVAVVVIPGNAD